MNNPIDIKKDNLWHLMYRMSLPGIAATLLISFNTFIDAAYVGYFLGTDALAGISLVIPLTIITTSCMVLLASGAASVLSRAIGKNDVWVQRHILSTLFTLSFIVSTFLAVAGYFYSDTLLSLMGGTEDVLRYGADYYGLWALGSFFNVFGLSANGLIRAEGRIKQAMTYTVLSVITNALLTPLFIYVFDWGIKGAALAYNVSMAVYTFYTCRYFLLGRASFDAGKLKLCVNKELAASILSIGASAFILQITNFVRQAFIFKSMSYYGTNESIAFLGAAFRIFSFLILPVFGLLQVLQPIVGINYGANNYERCIKAVSVFRIAGMLFVLLMWVPLMCFPQQLISVVLPGQQFSHEELNCFRIMLWAMPLFPISISGIIFFQATGNAKMSALLSVGREVLLFIPLIIILPMSYKTNGIYYSIAIENFTYVCVVFVLTHYAFKKIKPTHHTAPII